MAVFIIIIVGVNSKTYSGTGNVPRFGPAFLKLITLVSITCAFYC